MLTVGPEVKRKLSSYAKNQKVMTLAGVAGCVVLLTAFSSSGSSATGEGLGGVRQVAKSVDLSSFKHCPGTNPILPMPKDEWMTKPLWLPQFHHSMPHHLDDKLINPLTKTEAGAKDFYTSGPGLHQCVADTETVTCNNIYPKMDMDINSHYDQFYNKYILFIRNPMTAIPSSHNSKLNRFHSVIGQTPEDEWASTRDGWVAPMYKQWKNSILAWRDSKYELGMYLVYEDLMDVKRGPQALKKMSALLREAGFDAESDEEAIQCIWYNGIGKESIENHKKMGQEYDGYIPGFREAHKTFFLRELDKFLKEIRGDVELENILLRYKWEIDGRIRIGV